MLSKRKIEYFLSRLYRKYIDRGTVPSDSKLIHEFNRRLVDDKILNPDFTYTEFKIEGTWRQHEKFSIDKWNDMVEAIDFDLQLCYDELQSILSRVDFKIEDITKDVDIKPFPVYQSKIGGRFPFYLPFYEVKHGKFSTESPEIVSDGLSDQKGLLPGSDWAAVVEGERKSYYAFYGISDKDVVEMAFKLNIIEHPLDGTRCIEASLLIDSICEVSLSYSNSEEELVTITQTGRRNVLFVLPEPTFSNTFFITFTCKVESGDPVLAGFDRITNFNGYNSSRGELITKTIKVSDKPINTLKIEVDYTQPPGTYALFYIAKDPYTNYFALDSNNLIVSTDNINATQASIKPVTHINKTAFLQSDLLEFAQNVSPVSVSDLNYELVSPFNTPAPCVDENGNVGKYELNFNQIFTKVDTYESPVEAGLVDAYSIAKINNQIDCESMHIYYGKNCWYYEESKYYDEIIEQTTVSINNSGWGEFVVNSAIVPKDPVLNIFKISNQTADITPLDFGVDWTYGTRLSSASDNIVSIFADSYANKDIIVEYKRFISKRKIYVTTIIKVFDELEIVHDCNYKSTDRRYISHIDVATLDPNTGAILEYNTHNRNKNTRITIKLQKGVYKLFIQCPEQYSQEDGLTPIGYNEVFKTLRFTGNYIQYVDLFSLTYTPYYNFEYFTTPLSNIYFTVKDMEVIVNNLFISDLVNPTKRLIGPDYKLKKRVDFAKIKVEDYFYIESTKGITQTTNVVMKICLVSMSKFQTPVINDIRIIGE